MLGPGPTGFGPWIPDREDASTFDLNTFYNLTDNLGSITVLDSKTAKQIFLHHHLDVFQMQLK